MSWPAFGGVSLRDCTLDFERGIWGKMHAVPTDYRWIGRSPGFPSARDGAELLLLVGLENAPVPASLWRSHEGRYFAAGTYASPARDAAGRSGFLEKQVCLLPGAGDLPAAMAAMGLLPWVRARTYEDWWGQRQDPSWPEKSHQMHLEPESITVTAEQLEEHISRGLSELWALGAERLQRAYAGVLSGRSTSYLEGVLAPLSAQATAALLLPLERPLADASSVAGWSLSARYRRQRRELAWTLLVLDRAAREDAESSPPSMPYSADDERRAEEIVRAIEERSPARLSPPREPESVAVPEAQSASQFGAVTGQLPAPESTAPAEPAPPGSELALPVAEAAPPVAEPGSPSPELALPPAGGMVPDWAPTVSATLVDEPLPTPGDTKPPDTEKEPVDEWAPPRIDGALIATVANTVRYSPLDDLCDDLRKGAGKEELQAHAEILSTLSELVRHWVQYACDGSTYLPAEDLDFGDHWIIPEPGAPDIEVLWAAFRRAAMNGQEATPKADLFRAALFVLDASLSLDDARALMDSIKDVRPLAFIERLDAGSEKRLRERFAEIWAEIPKA